MQRLFDFYLSEHRYWEDLWQNAHAELTNKASPLKIQYVQQVKVRYLWNRADGESLVSIYNLLLDARTEQSSRLSLIKAVGLYRPSLGELKQIVALQLD